MLRILKFGCVVVGCLGLTNSMASSQEVVHAMTGTVRSIDAAHNTFTLWRDNGSQVTFKSTAPAKVHIANDKRILSDATAASVFNKKGAYVIVFYFGESDNPTAVALQALGQGPLTSTTGKVASFDERARLISVQDTSGSIQRYKIDADTVAESGFGVVEGLRLHVEKGDHVRVVGAASKSGPTALFINVT